MAKRNPHLGPSKRDFPIGLPGHLPLWELDIAELTGHNLEARGREEVNRLLEAGWRLLHIYTLKYEEDGVWRERPMGILGRLRHEQPDDDGENPSLAGQSAGPEGRRLGHRRRLQAEEERGVILRAR